MTERFPIPPLWKVMEVTRSSYYRWKRGKTLARQTDDQLLLEAITQVRQDRRKRCYGSRRLSQALQEMGFGVGRKRVRRLMRQAGILAGRRRAWRAKTTDSNHLNPVAPNLVDRQFDPKAPHKVWGGDITYLRCGSGWVYLAVIMDLYSRRIIGWSIQHILHRQLVVDALQMAWGLSGRIRAVIFHSDRGSQYASRQFRGLLAACKMTASMLGKVDCWDNAPVESFFSSLKKEAFLPPTLSAAQMRREVFKYIEVFYNRQRIHSTLGGISPERYEDLTNQSPKLCA